MLIFATVQIYAPYANAALPEEVKLFRQNILHYEYPETEDTCIPETSSNVSAGAGKPTGLTFPNLNPDSMADAINKYIKEATPGSLMQGLGDVIVAGAQNSNISPFLLVGIAQKESGIGDPGFGDGFNVRRANNSFGRSATLSQPHVIGSRPWYKWSTIKASVDHTAPENKNAAGGGDAAAYISKEYAKEIGKEDIDAFMHRYAPPGDNNDTAGYIVSLKKAIKTMAGYTAGAESMPEPPAGLTADPTTSSCCAQDSPSTAPGRNNEEKTWNFLITEMGLSENQASGVMGNIQQESGFRTDAVNPSSGAYGIIQWLGGRKTKLEQYAKDQGKPLTNIDMQLQFMKIELEGSYKSTVLEPIKASTTIAEATRIWLERFEIPCLPGSGQCDDEMNIRVPNALIWSGKFGGGKASTESGDDTSCAGSTNGATGTGVKVGDLAWPVPVKWVNSNFEWFTKVHHDHPSSDIPVPTGTDTYSITDGKVLAINQTGQSGGYGTYVTIESKGALFRYQHGVASSVTVKVGQDVTAGQLIMKVGNTGFSTGPHLHVSIETVGGGPLQRSTEHCPQELFKAMKDKKAVESFSSLPTSGCVGGASLY